MTAPAKKVATYQDIIDLPPHVVGQIINGELIVSPRPAFGHGGVTSTLGMDLGGPFQRGRGGPGGWWIYFEPELHFSRDVLVPDLAGWRVERMPQRPSSKTPYIKLAPDWVCEVLSPSTASIDRVAKSRVYAREGVAFMWIIDPQLRTLEASRLENGHWLQLGSWRDSETPRVQPFEAIELQLADLWSPQSEEP
jgi:Uma2 family endonuclease